MLDVDKNKKIRLLFFATFVAWSILSILLFQIRNIINYPKIEIYFPVIEFIFDIPMIYFSWTFYRKVDANKIYILSLFLSFLGLLLTDSGFYFVYYILNITVITNIWNCLYMFPFVIFLLGQISFWMGVVNQNIFQGSNRFYTASLFAMLSLFAMAIFIMSTTWKVYIFSYVGFYEVITAIFEFIIFDLAILSLVCSKNSGLNFLSSGTIILIATNLWEKYIFDSGRWSDFNFSEIFWLIGQITILFGLLYIGMSKTYLPMWTSSLRKIRSQISLWIFSLMNLSFLAIFFIGYFVGLISKNSLMSLPFLMMIYALVIVLISNYIGSKFEKPFNELKINIDNLTASKFEDVHLSNNFMTDEFIFLQKFIVNAFKIQSERNKDRIKLADMALRVAHDIRSPIAVMEMSLKLIEKSIPKNDISMFKMSIQSVRDIANNLLDRYRNDHQEDEINLITHDDGLEAHPILMCSLVEQVISQKRHEWSGKVCELIFLLSPSAKPIWVNVVPNDVKRMLSNLLNNAIEACDSSPRIEVSVDKINDFIELSISDNGAGISTDKIAKCLQGESSKHLGKGFGLSGAKQFMESIDGQLAVVSQVGVGTKISLNFNIYDNPDFYPGFIFISKQAHVIVLDDDISIQSLWFHRLQDYPVKIQLFSKYAEATKWINNNKTRLDKMIFLVDYELSESGINGLDLLKYVNVGHRGYLVTSHAEEINIQKCVDAIGVRLIPKSLASDIPFYFEE